MTEALTLNLSDTSRIRHIETAAPSKNLAASGKSAAPSGLSSISSIATAKVSEREARRNRPILELPGRHYMLEVIDLEKISEDTVTREAKYFRADTTARNERIQKLEQDVLDALQRQAEEEAKRNSWSVLGSVAQYLLSLVTIAAGVAVLAVNPVAGGLMIAAGGLGLVNKAVHDFSGWDKLTAWFTESKELQQSIGSKIELGFNALSVALGIAGGTVACFASNAGAIGLAMKEGFAAKAATGIGLGAGVVKGTSELGRSIAEKNASENRADASLTRSRIEIEQLEQADDSSTAKNFVEMPGQLAAAIGEGIEGGELDL
jgi:hypothetical protein